MTELKCPIHNTSLEEDFGYDGDYSCSKCGSNIMFGSEELWQELINTTRERDQNKENLEWAVKELETTRKALDIAMNALKEISLLYSEKRNSPESVWTITAIDMAEYADTALAQINEIKGGK